MSSSTRRIFCVVICIAVAGCSSDDYARLGGERLGTHFAIEAKCLVLPTYSTIDQLLNDIDAALSVRKQTSEISEFNQATVGTWFPVSPLFLDFLDRASQITDETERAYDPIVHSQTHSGQGALDSQDARATGDTIRTAEKLNWIDLIEIDHVTQSIRKLGEIELDFEDATTGYAVDEIAQLLEQHQCAAFRIEIGATIRTYRTDPLDDHWRTNIQSAGSTDGIVETLVMSNSAMSFVKSNDERPVSKDRRFGAEGEAKAQRQKQPDEFRVVVVRDTALEASVWAVVLYELGKQEAPNFAIAHDIAAHFQVLESDPTRWQSFYTPMIRRLLVRYSN